jgi:hypothetical protein
VDAGLSHITPARGPPLWDGAEAKVGESAEPASDRDEAAQPAADFEVDQRISCLGGNSGHANGGGQITPITTQSVSC